MRVCKKWTDDDVVQWATHYLNWGFTFMDMEKLLKVSHSTIWWCLVNRLPKVRPDLSEPVKSQISQHKHHCVKDTV